MVHFSKLVASVRFLFIAASVFFVLACQQESNASGATNAADQALAKKGKTTDLLQLKTVFATKLKQAGLQFDVTDMKKTAASGVFKAELDGQRSVYVVGNGEYFFASDLYALRDSEAVNLSEQERNGPRAQLLAAVKKDDMIVFAPKTASKAVISVYTDVDCGYCQKLHNEVPELNALGIEVRYLAYPRAGIGSPSYNKITSAWCADNPQEALTKLKRRESIPTKLCDNNPVAAQFEMGQKMGISGTPSIVLNDGRLLPGYMPAKDLAKRLGI